MKSITLSHKSSRPVTIRFRRIEIRPEWETECSICGWPIDRGDIAVEATWSGDTIAIACSRSCAVKEAESEYEKVYFVEELEFVNA